MSDPFLACIMCPHALSDVQSVKFICRTQDGWAAGCSEQCLGKNTEETLGMAHLGHLESISEIPEDYYSLPINFSMKQTNNSWSLSYYHSAYSPEEGDFVAPEQDSHFLCLPNTDKVFAFLLPNGSPVTITLDEGTRCIPFWRKIEQAENFRAHLAGVEKLERIKLGEVRNFATQYKIKFLAANFLTNSYDLAILA